MEIDYKKIGKIMAWEIFEGETWKDVFSRNGKKTDTVPFSEVIDIQDAGGLEEYISKKIFQTEKEIFEAIMEIFRKTINEEVFYSTSKNDFPTLYNFFMYVQKLDRAGKLATEAKKIATTCWNAGMMAKVLKKKTMKIFSEKPDKNEYQKSVAEIKKIYNIDYIDIEKIRYFVCQAKSFDFNPALNKVLYIWSAKKGTGKTTVGRAIVSILNGDSKLNDAYKSEFNIEMQMSDHALPKATYYNAVLLDEAIPNDTKKIYGYFKANITSASITFNPKHLRLIDVPIRRNYLMTSNYPSYTIIQDDDERRIFDVQMSETPNQLSFEDIYKLWKNFIVNCEPEENLKVWYDSFDLVIGMGTKRKEEYLSYIITENHIANQLRVQENNYVSIGFFYRELEKGKCTSEEKTHIKNAVLEIAEEAQPSRWRVADILNGIYKRQSESNIINVENFEEKGGNDGLPF